MCSVRHKHDWQQVKEKKHMPKNHSSCIIKTLNRFLEQDKSLNLCFITGYCTSTKERVVRKSDSFLGDTQKTQDLGTELVASTESTQGDQDTASPFLLQINILLLRAAWLPGSPAKENSKHHCTYSSQQQCSL